MKKKDEEEEKGEEEEEKEEQQQQQQQQQEDFGSRGCTGSYPLLGVSSEQCEGIDEELL